MKKDKAGKGPFCQVTFCTRSALRKYDVNGKGKMMWLCERHLTHIE